MVASMTGLNKTQVRKFLLYLDTITNRLSVPIAFIKTSQRQQNLHAQRYRNIKTALSIVRHYVDGTNGTSTRQPRPSFRRTLQNNPLPRKY